MHAVANALFLITLLIHLIPSLTHAFSFPSTKSIGFYNIPGSDPDRPGKVNQDSHFSFIITHSSTPSTTKEIFGAGVLDGHGKKGHVVSQFFKDKLPERLLISSDELLRNDDDDGGKIIPEVLVDVFEKSHEDAMQDPSVPAGRSGTTCVTCVVASDDGQNIINLHVANVGDSRAILGYNKNMCNGGGDDDDLLKKEELKRPDGSCWKVQPLSLETTTKRPREKDRISSCEQSRIDSEGNVWYGPVAIAMTRALGDAVMLNAGVISTPEVRSFQLVVPVPPMHQKYSDDSNDDDQKKKKSLGWVVILATDGITDVMSNSEMMEIVLDSLFLLSDESFIDEESILTEAAAKRISEEAAKRWQGDLPLEVKRDDITCALIVGSFFPDT